MAFNVNLYSFSKEVNSTARPSLAGATYSSTSNETLDILSPRIPLNIGAAANPSAYNYMYIGAFGRYYWIRTWRWEAGLWVAYCDVDPLASWKTEIGATSAYVLRAAAASDDSIIDRLYPANVANTYEFDTESPPWDLNPADDLYVVGIIGSGATQYYTFTKAHLDSYLAYILSDQYATAALGTLALQTNPELKVQLNPLQFITSIVRIPMAVSPASTVASIKTGLVDVPVTAGTMPIRITKQITWTLRRHPDTAARGSWINAGGSRYYLSIPPFGTVDLDPVTIANSTTVTADMEVDPRTGSATLRLSANGKFLSLLKAQVGLAYSVGNSVAPGWGINSAFQSFARTGAALLSGNVAGAIGGLLGYIGECTEAMIPKASVIGGVSGTDGFGGLWTMFYEWQHYAPEDNAHRGRPLCQVRQLSTLGGYQLCTDTDIQIPATRQEIDMIRSYLESGYYYE